MKLERLAYELSILSRVIAYPNISTASLQVGISQPQISRIIKKIEDELEINILERQSKRHSSWAPIAYKITESFNDYKSRFEEHLKSLTHSEEYEEIKIGTLEGLIPFSIQLAELLFKKTSLKIIKLHVYDRDFLDESFLKGNLDLILTFNPQLKRKSNYEIILGYQTLENIKNDGAYLVKSSFEFTSSHLKKTNYKLKKTLVSNSLEIRKSWIQKYGGEGILPSSVSLKAYKGASPVVLIGHESISVKLWHTIQDLRLS